MVSWLSSNGDEPMDRNYVRNVLNYINDLKESFSEEEFKCIERKHQDLQARLEERHQHQGINGGIEEGGGTEGREGCEVSWDSLLCWPYTSPGTLAILPCFEELNGIRYDNTPSLGKGTCSKGSTRNSFPV
ncbi:diuretic hormone receptor-like isoform X1 [Vespula squamosa]|uniref:Diuretic hormone receptor-like isoform X1 n=1 Tax=Vespula squamosa TaxID=30214 RepID=A0ABD2BLY8_VESSQ